MTLTLLKVDEAASKILGVLTGGGLTLLPGDVVIVTPILPDSFDSTSAFLLVPATLLSLSLVSCIGLSSLLLLLSSARSATGLLLLFDSFSSDGSDRNNRNGEDEIGSMGEYRPNTNTNVMS